MPDDERCWHFLLVDGHEQTIACARYLVHSPKATYEQLRIAQSPLAQDPRWNKRLRQTVEATLQRAKDEQVRYVELGSWALAEEYRNTKASLEIIVAPYLWAEMVGHCLFSCMATVRDRASSVLRRVGAQSLTNCGEPFPAYFDPQYNCAMEWLGFDSRQVPPRLLSPYLLLTCPRVALFASIRITLCDTNRRPAFVESGHDKQRIGRA